MKISENNLYISHSNINQTDGLGIKNVICYGYVTRSTFF